MKNLQFNFYQCKAGHGWGKAGWAKKYKPIHTPPHGTWLKSRPIPTPPPLQGGENPRVVKWGEVGQAGPGKIANPNKRERFKIFKVGPRFTEVKL